MCQIMVSKMNVIYDEITGVYKAARITGPAHNLLGLKLALSDEAPRLIDLEDKKEGKFLDVSKLQTSVTLGLIEANANFGKNIKLSEIYYVSSDTEDYDIYHHLTFKIIEYLASKA